MSARAAARLRTLGFAQVFRYTAGKMDWFASGWPRAGKLAARIRVGAIARQDAPTCEPGERIADVARRVRAAGWDRCVVVDADRIVLGLLDGEALGDDALVEQAMREGPTTMRPHIPVQDAADRLKRRDADAIVITTSSGRLVGILRRSDIVQRAREAQPTEAATR